ncbi:MAG: DNA gyrase subunit B [Clostridia bacterium]|nr:DNA gyrase subunit B [Clostridia bacterium]
MVNNNYDSSSLTVIEGLDAVRATPGMYIGSTGPRGLHHILWEIVDNAVDEAANGYASEVGITFNTDGSVTVSDNGRGIPVDLHPKLKKPGVEVVFTYLHAGGKFDKAAYSYSGGLHGVGASVTNALSEWLKAEITKDGKLYTISFKSYYDKKKKKQMCGVLDQPLESKPLRTKKTGSVITFLPDKDVFSDISFSYEIVENRVRELAFLNKNVKFILSDLRSEKSDVFLYSGGIADYATYLCDGKIPMLRQPIYLEASSDDMLFEAAIQYKNNDSESMYSFVNNIPTTDGGTHETGFKSGLTKVLNDFAKTNNLVKDKEMTLTGEDYREGICVVLSVKMKSVQFEGQTKTKLGSVEAKTAVEALTIQSLSAYLDAKKSVGTQIIKKAMVAGQARLDAQHAKMISKSKNSIDSISTLVGKLSSCTGRNAKINELFIVEGDSAGGSAKQARDRKFQAILPLKGKPVNIEKKGLKAILDNDEIRSIISALGTGIGDDYKADDLNYDKVIILSDADQDGAHIRALLMTFFFRYMKQLVLDGHVYIGLAPLYRVYKKGITEYCYDDEELAVAMDRVGKGAELQRYKGLGEMNPSQLWETTLNPVTRSLIRVTIEDIAIADVMTYAWMGGLPEKRKEYINKYCNFNKNNDAAVDKYLK